MARPEFKESRSLRLRTFTRDLRNAVRDDNDTLASDLIHELDMADLMVKQFPEKHFRILCSVMRTRPFRRSVKAAPHVLHLFTLEQWENLSPNQKRRLLAELEWLYPRVAASAWNLCFLVTVLLGEHFRDEQALKALLRLADVPREHARALVPHGLEHIVRDSGNPTLATIALEKLRKMATDPSAQVRDEVALSIGRIEQPRSPRSGA